MFVSPKGHKCFIVALEGPDRLGKSTQAALLETAMETARIRGVFDKCPYKDGVTYERIYEMLRTGEAVKYPTVFQTLQGANRMAFQKTLLPTLALHFDVVVIDRWNVSTLVYGGEAGVPQETTDCILKGIVEPDLVFVFDGEQFDAPDADDAYEADKEFQGRLRRRYAAWADAHPDITVKVNANQDKRLISLDLLDGIKKLLR
jgi:thymidylate kinase